MTKSEFRKSLLAARRGLDPIQREIFGQRIQEKAWMLPQWQASRVLGIYMALPDEVPTLDCIHRAWQEGKTVASPVLANDAIDFYIWDNFNQLEPGPMGILQPRQRKQAAPEQFDLLLIPGVGFDLRGCRLGFGKGYYDRFLAKTSAYRVGLAFELQVAAELPATDHDLPMDVILTETRSLP